MNTTHSTSDSSPRANVRDSSPRASVRDSFSSSAASRVPYTVLGGPRWNRVRKYPFRLTLLVLSRGDRLFRAELLRDLHALGAGEILWVEGHEPSCDVESLSRDFPFVRFLLMKAPTTAGERINIGIAESRAPFVLSMWSDMRLSPLPPSLLVSAEKSGAVCTVPLARNAIQEKIPSWQSPVWKKRRFSLAFRAPRRDGELTLFPFDYCGLYSRESFARSGGFDPAISNSYWQKLDFGFRCFLWGERLRGSIDLAVAYVGAPPTENATPDQGYKLFYLKNLAVRMRREMGVLPTWKFFDYLAHCGTGPLSAAREFLAVRDWVRIHRFRFRRDPMDVIARWESA